MAHSCCGTGWLLHTYAMACIPRGTFIQWYMHVMVHLCGSTFMPWLVHLHTDMHINKCSKKIKRIESRNWRRAQWESILQAGAQSPQHWIIENQQRALLVFWHYGIFSCSAYHDTWMPVIKILGIQSMENKISRSVSLIAADVYTEQLALFRGAWAAVSCFQ